MVSRVPPLPRAGGKRKGGGRAAMAPGGQTPPARRALTSVPLQVALYVGGWWDAVYVLLTLAIFIYKGARPCPRPCPRPHPAPPSAPPPRGPTD